MKSSKYFIKKFFTKKPSYYNQHKEEVRALIASRLIYYASVYGVVYGRVSIRNQKSRWGSCSARGNLNFNYKLLFLPVCMRDYIIVHELCHLKELNHGPNFWRLVGEQIPNYREIEISLRHLEKSTRMLPYSIRKYSQNHTCANCNEKRIELSSGLNLLSIR